MGTVKRTGIVAGVAAGAAGAAVAATKVAARQMRKEPDGDAARALEAQTYLSHRLDTHDRGSIYVV
jgi:hypothetical protein